VASGISPAALPAPVIELHCVCSVEVAVTRWLTRKQHAGHLDHARSYDSLLVQFEAVARLGPLRIGPVYEVPTDAAVDLASLDAWMQSHGFGHFDNRSA
jgi:hypothetical protein